jgi:hypothetical protein
MYARRQTPSRSSPSGSTNSPPPRSPICGEQQAQGLKTVMLLCDRGSWQARQVSRWESEAAAEAAERVYQAGLRRDRGLTG